MTVIHFISRLGLQRGGRVESGSVFSNDYSLDWEKKLARYTNCGCVLQPGVQTSSRFPCKGGPGMVVYNKC